MAISGLFGAQRALSLFDRSSSNAERTRATGATNLPVSVLPAGTTSRSTRVVSVSAAQGEVLVGRAGTAAESIGRDLAQLRQLALQARSPAVQAQASDTGATALSAQAKFALGRIDAAVKAATLGAANLVRSGASDVRINARTAGGEIVAAVQTLDAKGLGLEGLDIAADPDKALARIDAAIASAGVKTQRIDALARTFQEQGAFLNAVTTVSSETRSGYGPSGARGNAATRGSFLNILA